MYDVSHVGKFFCVPCRRGAGTLVLAYESRM
jgi:hypothetical protein